MTPELIQYVLALPLDVRMALLDADPKVDGRLVWPNGYVSKPLERAELDTVTLRGQVASGYAWLPSNPLAVIEVAARLFAQRHDLALQIAQECTAALYFGETHKAMGVIYRILGMVAPGARLIHDNDSPRAAYCSVHPEVQHG